MRSKFILLSLCALLLLSATSCNENRSNQPSTTPPPATTAPVTYSYTEEYLRIEEPQSPSWLISGTNEKTEVDGITYYFAPAISESERGAFIAAQQKICALLQKNGLDTSDLKFYVLADYPGLAVSADHSAYLGINLLHTPSQILTTLQAVWGEYTNYGYLWALSQELAQEFGWKTDQVMKADVQRFAKQPVLLHLVYPCFLEEFTDAKDVTACKNLSAELLAKMDNRFGGEQQFLQAIQAYAKEKKISYAPTDLRFAYIGTACKFKLLTPYMEVYLINDYIAGIQESPKAIAGDPMKKTDRIFAYFEQLNQDIQWATKVFHIQNAPILPTYLTDNLPDVDVGRLSGYFTAAYQKPVIYARNPYCLLHEYLHYLYYCREDSFGDGYESWHNEVLAYYFSRSEDYMERRAYMDYGLLGDDIYSRLHAMLGQPYDSPEDEILLNHIGAAVAEHPLFLLKTNNQACLSFGAYFASLYGEENLVTCMITPSRAKDLTGKTVHQIVDDWLVYLQTLPIERT